MRTAGYALAGASLLVGTALGTVDRPARAGTGIAGIDLLPVVAVAEAISLLGGDSVVLRGWVEVVRLAPRTEGGLEVIDLEITALDLVGASRFGLVSVTERAGSGGLYGSGGEIRALTPNSLFPANSRIDLFIDLAVPSSPAGPLLLHNETALHLAPSDNGMIAALHAWPPLGVTYQRDAAADCAPLLDEAGLETELGLCVGDLRIDIAPQLAGYSVARGSPSPLHPADIFGLTPTIAAPGTGQAPFVRLSCEGLGLTPEGCDDTSIQDEINALSFGTDAAGSDDLTVDFSVAPGAQGASGSAVEAQRSCPPAEPGSSPEPEPDVFRSRLQGTNEILFDGNGPVGSCQPAFPLGLLEAVAARDDLDAYTSASPRAVDANADGVPERPVYFSLDAASPSLAVLGYTPADVLVTSGGATPAIYAAAPALGLLPNDDIDALCLREDGDGAYSAGDALLFSLAAGSPTLQLIGATAGDLLAPRTTPIVMRDSTSLGLVAGDDVDAAGCSDALALTLGGGDVDCSGATNSIDAALTLQRVAGLLALLPCEANADVNGGGVTSIDAALILRFDAGLLDRLPAQMNGGLMHTPG